MRAKDFITEASTDYRERSAASDELHKIWQALANPKGKFKGDIDATAKRAKELIKITGRTNKEYGRDRDGYIYDRIVTMLTKLQQDSGQAIPFPKGTGTAVAFRNHLAMYFKGFNARARGFYARRWTMGMGGSYKDPENGLEFPTEDERDAAMEEIAKHATKVHTRDPYNRNRVQTFYKVGKFLLSPSSRTSNAFGDNPESEYFIMIQTSGILRNPLTAKVDITDQQAASLADIAATKNANAIEKIKAIMGILKGEQDLKQVIDNSKKITPQDKAKLDAIIAGAQNFKEP